MAAARLGLRRMQDERKKVNPDSQLVTELANGKAFLTAQIAGNEVVCSVILPQPEHPFSREGLESHFDHGSNFWSRAAFKVARSEVSRKLVKGHCPGRHEHWPIRDPSRKFQLRAIK